MEERCNIGCGCGRNKPNRSDRIKKTTVQVRKARLTNLNLTSMKPIVSPLTSHSSICLSCIESKQSPEERKRGIRVCHKCNRLLNNILKEQGFACPLGKWKI